MTRRLYPAEGPAVLTIDIYSGVIRPWCYVGKRRMEQGLAGRAAAVHWHPLELNPGMPPEGPSGGRTGSRSSGAGSGRSNWTRRSAGRSPAKASRSTPRR